jgi:hypothetical protein
MWSCFRRLRDHAEAPEEPGVYEIGVLRGGCSNHVPELRK